MAQVDAGLVQARDARFAFQQGVIAELFQHLESSHGALAVSRIHAHDSGAAALGPDFGIDGKLIFRRLAADEGDVAQEGFLAAEEIGERDEHRLGFRQQQHAGSLGVQAVPVHEIGKIALNRPRLAGLDGIVQEFDEGRPGRILAIRRRQHAARLFEREQVLILE